ncbi:response regulator [Argonema antarcticum]|uniref:hybrid sensor histidine kinase/response regulator n=1 Tax=Argonema antarcticum TaxID=2942763 RepID=UPI0020118DA0|nr:response regulator [Argonema antarcticum]MCL1470197.1 response regulator [Argonema antarcticum A004/B2]
MSIESTPKAVLLIVDDTPANLGVLSDFLDEAGFEVLVARDGESAIQKVQYAKPDIILLDVMMPGIDGFETCHRLKADPSTEDIPVIFMTALSETVDKVKGFNLGAVDYITKPFQQEEVLARVKAQLKLHNLTKIIEQQNILLKREVEDRVAAEIALKKLTQELEKQVEERTDELRQALENLQQTQIYLVQKEKMSALGQLVAGVAHEINNPVSFIAGNISHAETYIQDLLDHLKLYQQKFPNPGAEIEDHAEEIELDYFTEDLLKLISSMKTGTERINQISVSLRTFSRSDTSSKVAVNIHEGIDSTLLILKHRLKAKDKCPAIEIIKEYGELPLVECYAGQLNQVFMNIIANAIDALEECSQGHSYEENKTRANTITIRTEFSESKDRVIIRIEDNGIGMSAEVRERIFEPLFTTKAVGKGTGLGLSISNQIVVEKHGGEMTCVSAPGKGTEFIITLPINS